MCVMDRGQFDTELTLRILREGIRVAECPAEYIEYRCARNLLVKKIIWNIVAIIRMWYVLRNIKYKTYVKLYRFSRHDLLEESKKYGIDLEEPIY